MHQIRFRLEDLADDLPEPGFYPASVLSAEFHRSHARNHMVRVVLVLDGVALPHDRVFDYFVLDGASSRGVATAWRRLVQLHRACGLCPQKDDPLVLHHLEGCRVEVKVAHTIYERERRLRVVAYRPVLQGELTFLKAHEQEQSAS